ncbi:MAG: response regulator transcription factor [Epsilonproteobacteria bacterium]|nr:response regulator transcription factor [Campylobacterota bacterium]
MIIVLTEDDKSLNFAIKLLLEKNGHKIYAFENPDDLINTLDDIGKIDLFILDINLPGMDGLELMEHLKLYKNSNFIIISGYTDISHISHAFNIGCEDYLKKPFEIEELLIRVKKIEKKLYPKSIVSFGDIYSYDFENKILTKNDKQITLTKRESSIIEILLKNIGKVVSLDNLCQNVWQEEVSNNTISATMYRLRNKIDDNIILTFRDVGYMIPG